MTQYVAWLRGVNSGQNPSQRMVNLRAMFESLGLKNVQTVIASGNVVFETDAPNRAALETKIEQATHAQLGFTSGVIIWSQAELEQLIKSNPFKAVTVTDTIKPHVTFVKAGAVSNLTLPYAGKGYKILNNYNGAICSVLDLAQTGSPDLMAFLDKQFHKQVTTRTWGTVNKVAAKMGG